MDFWSRLLGGSLAPASSRKDDAKNPTKRLHRFDKEYSQILHLWRTSSNLSRDDDAAEALEIRLQELTNILSDETRRPLPHPCIQYAAKKQIYHSIGRIASTSHNEWIMKEAVHLFATLVETDEEAFVESSAFSASLTNLLVRITGVNSVRMGSDTEAKVVELAFNITTKIRLEPDILSAWFKAQRHDDSPDERSRDKQNSFAGRTQKQDFPLFYILMDYIQHDGKVGDFARTGLLYIIEAASGSEALEQWIVESDLSTLMATGLGALYSQLSRKLVIDHPPHELPPILALSDYQHPTSTYEIVSSCSPDFQLHLETFLSHLLFWQDVLEHCKSLEVKQTLLEHFQVIFLQQLLYPSLLESSDIDGGSSVAVLTYLRRILESLDHPDMINLILHYLLGLPDHLPPKTSGSRTSISDARRRKSMDLASMLAQTSLEPTATPLLFNLVDLILACLRSQNQQTIHVTLQLASAILKRHHRYAVITLLRTEGTRGESARRTVGAHGQEVDFLVKMACSLGGQENFDEVYDSILKDTSSRVESHPCSLKLVAPKISTNNHELPAIPDSLPGAPRDVREHTLRPDDPLLRALLDLLETFFTNPVDTNLSLTEALVNLGSCGYMTIEGWFLRSPQKYAFDEVPASPTSSEPTAVAASVDGGGEEAEHSEYAAELEKLKAINECRKCPIWTPASLPRLMMVLERLCGQVSKYRETIPRFDDLLQQRREAFQTADSAFTPAPIPNRKPTPHQHSSTQTPDRRSFDEPSRSGSPVARPSAIEGFAQRLLSELGTPSRSSSPRGRKEQSRGSGAASPTPGASSSTQVRPVPIPPPKDYPPVHDGSFRGGGLPRSFSPGSTSASVVSGGRNASRDPVTRGQQAAFAAVDQTILARRVGIPGTVEAIPFRLGGSSATQEEPGSKSKPETSQGQILSTPHIPPPKDEDGEVVEEDEEDESGAKRESESGGGANRDGEGEEVEGEPRREEEEEEKEAETEEARTASVSHVITNVLILQGFLFELAALVQVRAALFNEVRFA